LLEPLFKLASFSGGSDNTVKMWKLLQADMEDGALILLRWRFAQIQQKTSLLPQSAGLPKATIDHLSRNYVGSGALDAELPKSTIANAPQDDSGLRPSIVELPKSMIAGPVQDVGSSPST